MRNEQKKKKNNKNYELLHQNKTKTIKKNAKQ